MFKNIAFVTLWLGCIAGFAQENTDTISYAIDLDQMVITAQYAPTHYKKAIHNIKIINREKIQKIGATTLDQVVSLTSSIRLYKDPILGTSVRMRGISSNNVAILKDGIPMIGRNGGAIDISQISTHTIERIEIIEGPLSNNYGNNAAGGVINIITKSSQTSQWSTKLSSQFESIGQQEYTANMGYNNTKIGVGIHGRHFNYQQFSIDSMRISDTETLSNGEKVTVSRYPYNPKNQYAYGIYTKYKVSENQSLLAKYDQNNEDVSDYGFVRRPSYKPYSNDTYYTTDRQDISLVYKGIFDEVLHVGATLSHNIYDRVRNKKRYYLETMEFDEKLQFTDSIRFKQLYGRMNAHWTKWDSWVLAAGVTYIKESGKGNKLIERGTEDSLHVSQIETALNSELKYEGFKNTTLSISNRYTHHNLYKGNLTTALLSKIDLSDKLSLRASYAQGYRSPSLKELYIEFIDINHYIVGNPKLKPEHSYDTQATLTYQPHRQIELSLNGYYTEITNRISLIEFENLKYNYANVDKYNVLGLQLSADYTYNTTLKLHSDISSGYWATSIDKSDVPKYGNIIDISNSLNYTLKRLNIDCFLSHRYVGNQPQYRSSGKTVKVITIDGYNLFDTSITKSFWENRIRLTGGVRNIFNIQSTNVSGGSSGAHSGSSRNFVNAGRSWFLSLGIDFE